MEVDRFSRYFEWYNIQSVVPPESPIEKAMFAFLTVAPLLETKTVFAVAEDWRDALALLDQDAAHLSRRLCVVFPQVAVDRYRADFLVAVTGRWFDQPDAFERFDAFFIECDGAEFHGGPGFTGVVSFDRIRRDMDRESAIREITGLDVLRFAGSEIHYARGAIRTVLEAYIEALLAYRRLCWIRLESLINRGYARSEVQNCVPVMPPPIGRVIAEVRRLTGPPVLRHGLHQTAPIARALESLKQALDAMRLFLEQDHDDVF